MSNLDRLNEVLERAIRAPYYAERLPESVASRAEWETLPLTTKDDLRAAYPFGMLAVSRREIASYHESSGTSGEPTPSFFTESDWDDIATRFARNGVGLSPGDCVLVKTPYSLVTTAHQMHRAARLRGAMVIPADNRTTLMPYPKVIRLLRDLAVTVAWCLPTETLLWASAAELQGLDPARDFNALRAFLVAGEPLTESKRRRIEAIWKIAVFQDYGSTETGSLAGECRYRKLHAWSDKLFFEVRDPATGRYSPHGRGQLVVTPLFRQAMPLVRYAIDDIVEVSPTQCACGSSLPTLRVLGRAAAAARVQGRELHASELEELVYAQPVRFWRARWDAERLEVEIDAADACTRLEQTIGERLGIRAEVRGAKALVNAAALTQTMPFQKPRFLFHAAEDWTHGFNYGGNHA